MSFIAHGNLLPSLRGGASLTSSQASVNTEETTTSTTYVDLTTSGPAVTISPGDTKDHLILIRCGINNGGAGPQQSLASVSIAGASAADGDAARLDQRGTPNDIGGTFFSVALALATASGSTHTMKYRVTAGTGEFMDRRIVAIAL